MTSLGIDDFTDHKSLITFFPSHYILSRYFMKFWFDFRSPPGSWGRRNISCHFAISNFSTLISSITTNVIKHLINNTFPHAKKGSANSNFEMNFITRFFALIRNDGTRDISSWNWKNESILCLCTSPQNKREIVMGNEIVMPAHKKKPEI
jgi:hypothetical protein